ncbi:MAG: purine-nucleoside phosphorylase, partial [Candidatus Latescibacterota bacterium]
VLIKDHINLQGDNPLIGVYEQELGPRFSDMSKPYSYRLMALAKKIASQEGITLLDGVYVAVIGPSLETPAEYRFLRMIGADMVGMSTVPETIVAVQMGMEVLGVTIITDLCDPDALEPADIKDIIAASEKAEPRLTLLIKEVIRSI